MGWQTLSMTDIALAAMLWLKVKKESDPHVSFVKKFKGKWSPYFRKYLKESDPHTFTSVVCAII